MRLLLASLIAAAVLGGCKPSEEDQQTSCERASENARRLVADDARAHAAYGADPLPVERCRADGLTETELACLGYASDWAELQACAPNRLRSRSANVE